MNERQRQKINRAIAAYNENEQSFKPLVANNTNITHEDGDETELPEPARLIIRILNDREKRGGD